MTASNFSNVPKLVAVTLLATMAQSQVTYLCRTPTLTYEPGLNGWAGSDGSTGYCAAGTPCEMRTPQPSAYALCADHVQIMYKCVSPTENRDFIQGDMSNGWVGTNGEMGYCSTGVACSVKTAEPDPDNLCGVQTKRQKAGAVEREHGPVTYRCKSPNFHYHAGNNGWYASDGTTGYCKQGTPCASDFAALSAEEVCAVAYHCDTASTTYEAGRNGWAATDKTKGFCEVGSACWNGHVAMSLSDICQPVRYSCVAPMSQRRFDQAAKLEGDEGAAAAAAYPERSAWRATNGAAGSCPAGLACTARGEMTGSPTGLCGGGAGTKAAQLRASAAVDAGAAREAKEVHAYNTQLKANGGDFFAKLHHDPGHTLLAPVRGVGRVINDVGKGAHALGEGVYRGCRGGFRGCVKTLATGTKKVATAPARLGYRGGKFLVHHPTAPFRYVAHHKLRAAAIVGASVLTGGLADEAVAADAVADAGTGASAGTDADAGADADSIVHDADSRHTLHATCKFGVRRRLVGGSEAVVGVGTGRRLLCGDGVWSDIEDYSGQRDPSDSEFNDHRDHYGNLDPVDRARYSGGVDLNGEEAKLGLDREEAEKKLEHAKDEELAPQAKIQAEEQAVRHRRRSRPWYRAHMKRIGAGTLAAGGIGYGAFKVAGH